MIHLLFNKHLWYCLLFIGLLGASMLIGGCDDYNIVEPRFYSEDDIVEIPMLGAAEYVCAMVADAGGYVYPYGSRLPDRLAIDYSWCDERRMTVAVLVALPKSGNVRLLVLNSGGGISETLVEKKCEAGVFAVTWTPENDGVYGLVLNVDEFRLSPVWVEIK